MGRLVRFTSPNPLLVIFTGLTMVYAGYNLLRVFGGQAQGHDFSQLYMAGRTLMDGIPMAAYDSTASYDELAQSYGIIEYTTNGQIRGLPSNAYPPIVAILFWPMAGLSYRLSSFLFIGLSLVFLVLGSRYFGRQLSVRHRSEYEWGATLLPMIYFPCYYALYLGQVSPALLFCIVLFMDGVCSNQPRKAGFFLALAIHIKFFPLVLVGVALWRRQWNIVFWTLVWIFGILAVSLIVLGFDIHRYYFTEVLSLQVGTGPHPRNTGFHGLLARLFLPAGQISPAVHSETSFMFFYVALSLLSFLTTLWLTFRYRPRFHLTAMLWLMLTVLVIPKSWEHNAVFFLLLFWYLLAEFESGRLSNRWVLFLGTVSFSLRSFTYTTTTEILSFPNSPMTQLLLNLPLISTLMAVGILVYLIVSQSRSNNLEVVP